MLIFVFHLVFAAMKEFFLLCTANSGGTGLDMGRYCVME